MFTTHLPDQGGIVIFRSMGGRPPFSTTAEDEEVANAAVAVAVAEEDELPLLPPPTTPRGSSTSFQDTAPDAEGVNRAQRPFTALIAFNGSRSWHVAKKTFMLRARTDKWDNTSGASGVKTATTPSGTSSSPVTCSEIKTVGCSYTFSCTTSSPDTTSTIPVTATGLITCHAPKAAALRKTGSTADTAKDTAKAAEPRTTSSAKS
mmetsp:Transcript_25845/g.47201  ORF Transcript_25845/g.47201 Transcript_25845/m.47201 type:complete len:205 (-) Transcript_25845:308-922(-)